MLLYEVAFACLPFPIEYLAVAIKYRLKFVITFPDSKRTSSFRNFLLEILQIEPSKRGGGSGWKKNVTVAYSDFLARMASGKYEVKNGKLNDDHKSLFIIIDK